MKIVLKEYDVTPNSSDRNELNINIEGDTITFNTSTANDISKIKQIEDLVLSEKEKILELKDIRHAN